jgi:outer membrane lipoprotein-sorting protein
MKITILILVFTILTPLFIFSQPKGFLKVKNKQSVAQKISSASNKIKTIQSSFKQYKHLDILSNDIISEGKFSFKTSNLLRWQYIKPYDYLILMNGSNMWINDGKKTKKYDTGSNKMFKEINDLMLGLLQGDILKSKNFNLQLFENKKYILAELIPKSPEMKEFLSSINIYFDKLDYSVSKVKMSEHSGDYTKIEFFNKKNNISISDSKFSIK